MQVPSVRPIRHRCPFPGEAYDDSAVEDGRSVGGLFSFRKPSG